MKCPIDCCRLMMTVACDYCTYTNTVGDSMTCCEVVLSRDADGTPIRHENCPRLLIDGDESRNMEEEPKCRDCVYVRDLCNLKACYCWLEPQDLHDYPCGDPRSKMTHRACVRDEERKAKLKEQMEG